MNPKFREDLRRTAKNMLKAGKTASQKVSDITQEAVREWREVWREVHEEAGESMLPSPEPTHGQIAAKAYEIWLSKGCPEGTSAEDWAEAERELRGQ